MSTLVLGNFVLNIPTGGSTMRELFFVGKNFYEKILSISDKRGCSEKLNAWAT
jgi:hypothetical protein